MRVILGVGFYRFERHGFCRELDLEFHFDNSFNSFKGKLLWRKKYYKQSTRSNTNCFMGLFLTLHLKRILVTVISRTRNEDLRQTENTKHSFIVCLNKNV